MVISASGGDLVEMGRVDLVEQNVVHDFDHALVRRNLRGCYGELIARFYAEMIGHIVGTRVLDVGCGFGLFSHLCRKDGFQVHAIDIDEQSLEIARTEYQLDCQSESVYETSLANDSIDTVVFNDVIPHLELPKLMHELDRLGARRVIILDSNIANPFLRMYRAWTNHKEFRDYSMRDVLAGFNSMGFRTTRTTYHNYISLPISGGLQMNPVPILHRFPEAIFFLDRVLKTVMPWTFLSRFMAFRYLAILDRME